ncbi:uncharacterized protein Z518_03384 [Rhinocladiella mackenziei CBS 650.93]|uniref:Rhinocladiella mackenziei CBS 650.93 unplaced genomic scaffold supercont1.2, whole genome shotgun sequence n=1 Tax=Rhinocladiella mackenziei CBS 650.93 TaxID=1442369 RepID=A0A0D2G2G1_9EURO|nr:uncharacterized protein Z518_03384 [Rhinocladiella mackenziei CBS 650.93]KIX08727.1 hypothetical protein Z518_03384 [Rhinocladiella mackenziei CBS 650.93]
MANNAISNPNLCEITIERKNKLPIKKLAKRNWQSGQRCEITEACVQDLGFSTIEKNGEKRKSLRLRWAPKAAARTLEDEFFIVPEGDHEIVLGQEACDNWHYANNPGIYPCFMKKVSRETVAKKEEENKTRHAQEIAAEKAKWLEILQKERPSPLSETPASHL